MFHVVNCIVLGARLPIHASESLHGLDRNEITAVFVLDLLLASALEGLIIRGTANGCLFIYPAVVPCSRQTTLTISLGLGIVNSLIQLPPWLRLFLIFLISAYHRIYHMSVHILKS